MNVRRLQDGYMHGTIVETRGEADSDVITYVQVRMYVCAHVYMYNTNKRCLMYRHSCCDVWPQFIARAQEHLCTCIYVYVYARTCEMIRTAHKYQRLHVRRHVSVCVCVYVCVCVCVCTHR